MAHATSSASKQERRHGKKGSGYGMRLWRMHKNEKQERKKTRRLHNNILAQKKEYFWLSLLILKMAQEITNKNEWPLWEVFIRSKAGLDHKHAGSLHAADAEMAIENARDVYTRRMEGVSIWVVESRHIHASDPGESASLYDPANDKIYRHPTFYNLPDEVKYM